MIVMLTNKTCHISDIELFYLPQHRLGTKYYASF